MISALILSDPGQNDRWYISQGGNFALVNKSFGRGVFVTSQR